MSGFGFSDRVTGQCHLSEILRERELSNPCRKAYTFLDEAGGATSLSYGDLGGQAQAIAAQLQQLGGNGQRALLLYPPGLDFVAAFLGCLSGGVIAVPTQPMTSERGLPRLLAIARDARATFALTTTRLLGRLRTLTSRLPELEALTWVATDRISPDVAGMWQDPRPGPESLAFLQYTSGSTALPKGVKVSHGNLLHNEEMIRRAFGQSAESVIVGWLPLYHDMGLIGNVLQPLYLGAHAILMPPVAFLKRPISWLEAITRYRATTSGGPNFAYELCLRKITAEQRAGLDLSSWEVAFNGAEPVRSGTLDRFARTFASQGFRRSAFYPCYGLAEATLFVTGGGKGDLPVTLGVDRPALERREVAPSASGEAGSLELVGCGHPWMEQRVAIVDPDSGRRLGKGQVGEIWVSGPSVAQGYWGHPEETAQDFGAHLADPGEGPFLRTGDLGFLQGGELFVTGRLKDLIILRGRNLYPQDIELSAESSHPELRAGCSAAFPVDVDGEERLVLACELEPRAKTPGEGIAEAIRQAVAQEHEVQPHEIVLLEPGTIPKTSSGKIQRHACRQRYLAGELAARWRSRQMPAEEVAADHGTVGEEVARVLGIPAASLDPGKPLTAYGLDSLAAVEVQHALESRLGATVDLADLLRGTTLRQLEAQVLAGPVTPPVRPVPRTGSLPLSFAQERLWFIDQLEPGSPAYNLPVAVRLEGRLDFPALAASFHEIVRRHEALRTTFAVEQGRPAQRFTPAGSDPLPVVDLSGPSGLAGRREVAHRLAAEEARSSFDLERGPLWRAVLLRLDPDEHLLLLTLHHIVSDGWSMGVFARELSALYAAFVAGQPAPLPELPIQYADFAQWQRERMSGEVLEGQLAHWRRHLAGAPILELPGDRPPLKGRGSRGALLSTGFSHSLTRGLEELARREGGTLFMALLGGLAALLCRWTGQDDVSIGTAIANRNRAETEGLIGFFANTLALRTDLSGDPSGRDLLARVREVALAAYANQDLPFERLVQELQPQRDAETPPLFRVVLTLGADPALGLSLPGLAAEPRLLDTGTAKFDLTLQLWRSERGLAGVFEHSTGLFDPPAPRRLIRQLAVLLEELVADPRQRVSGLLLLTPAERHQLLAEWSGAAPRPPLENTLPELFAWQAERRPDAVAVSLEGKTQTYAELDRRANRLAHHLRRLGVGPEVPVGVCLERSFELIIALVAVAKSGGAYVPLDPGHPRQSLEFILAQTGAPVVLTRESLLGNLPQPLPGGTRALCFGGGERPWAGESTEAPGPAASPESLAYILYTSGSTGEPKGVAVPHRAVVRLVRDTGYASFGPGEVFLQLAPVAFDASTFEIWGPLLNGGRLALAPAGPLALTELERVIAGERVTTLWLTAGLFHQAVDQGLELRGLRQLLAGGDVLSPPHVRRALERIPGCVLVNGYGPTENTTFTSCHRMDRPEDVGTTVSLGRPIARTSVFVVDPAGQPCPVGVPGELWTGGDGLARGYVGRPGLTAERFVPDPFGASGSRLYRTGDRVRFLPDGSLEFLGRIDQQVKIRGFRIEPGEIEAVLAAHPGVEAVTVVPQELGPEDRRLVAYVVARPGQTPDFAELRDLAAQRLPGYMMPAAFVALAALPLTPNGKVDRRALPQPDWAGPEAPCATAVPRDPTEELLVGLWAELLGLEAGRVGIEADFFALGGHSLLATRLISRVREDLRVEVPLRGLFEAPTPAGLARLIQAAAREGPEAPPIRPVPRAGSLPLSFAQERLWFIDRFEPGSATYNIPAAVRLEGPLEIPALAASLQEIARRHEALRTTFTVEEDRPVQMIAPPAARWLPVADLAALDPAGREAEAQRLAAQEAERPFDLAAGPLLRVTVLRLASEDHLALFTFHHIVTDDWSIGVFMGELSALYPALRAGRPSPLPELPVQYADFAVWQRSRFQGEVLKVQLDFWRRHLAGAPVALDLPTDRPRPALQSFRGETRALAVPGGLGAALRELARREGATLFMALKAAFDTLLHRITGQDDLVVGTPIANRTRMEIEGLIGFFINTLAMRTGLSGDPAFREAVGRVRDVALGAYAHQDLPFEKLVEELQPERDRSRSPIFQVLFQVQNAPRAALELPGLSLRLEGDGGRTAKLDLALAVVDSGGELSGTWRYRTDLFDAATIARLEGSFLTLLAGILDDPERRLSELPLLTKLEQAQLLEWNATAVAYPPDLCLHELIERQVARTPEAVAVSFEGSELTYRELDARAGRLARSLRGLGAGPETRVGIAAERSLELVVGLLAILKAGGAYVPLDPGYPRERLAYLLQDSQVAVLLTQERLLAGLPGPSGRVLLLDHQAEDAPDVALPPIAPDNLAYVIYTSGSTGRPKGAMNTHRGIVNRLLWMQERYGLDASGRVLQKTPFSFDVSVWEFFWPLITGARLVMARPGGHQDPAYLVETIGREGITTLHFVPSMLQVFLEAPGVERCRSVTRVMASGEALPPELEQRFFARLGAVGAGLYNLYGPTEAAVDVTHWDCSPGTGRSTVPIGRPVANTAIHLVGRFFEPVPVGVPGELLIGGVQVARGYLGRPELTAERFIPDPFGKPGARLYRTGDLARRRVDGAVEFLGRLDHQVKIRGFRIELGEIEAALASHPAVREAVVQVRGGAAFGDQRLVAWVVGREGAPEAAELRRHLARTLPEPMVPSAFVALDAMPLSPNGKVDRRALPDPEAPRAEPGRERVAPRTELERLLAGLWREILHLEAAAVVGVHDNFFELGGNSLLSATLINRLQERLGEIVHVVALFDAPTVARLATLLEERYPAAVARLTGVAPAAGEEPTPAATRVEAPMLVRMRELMRADRAVRLGPRNRPAVFVLSPPRSGSTLLRVMLGGHGRLFAPPELELLSYSTLAERRTAFSGRDSFRLEGLTRAVMEVLGLDATSAARLIEEHEREGWTTQRLYGRLQERLGDRILVDKTPSYAFDLGVLTRAEEQFEDARYIHLVRHPCGMIHSFEESHVDQVFFRVEVPFSRRDLAELVWAVSHENIVQFLARVPQERQHRIRFEDLVREPQVAAEGICAFLGIDLQPDMIDPYSRRSGRMTDGLHRESRMLGDVKFHQHAGIDPAAADRWRKHMSESSLGEVTLRLAATLGYRSAELAIERALRQPGAPLPLSFSQERLWFLDRMMPGSPAYNMFAPVRLAGDLDVAAFRAALAEVVRRHETLRTTFAEEDSQPVQVVAAASQARFHPLPVADLSGLPEGERRAQALALAGDEARQPFDLATGPLLRTTLLRLGEEGTEPEHVLLLTMHHIVSDGWSMGVFLREVIALYGAFSAGLPSPLPELQIQYADYTLWQRRWLAGEVLRGELAHWRERLAGAPAALDLPTDRPRPPVQRHRGGHALIRYPEALAAALDTLARVERATLFMTLLAGVSTLLERYSGQDDLLLGSPVANRTRIEIEGLVGFFVNTLMLRSDISGDPSLRGLLARIRESALDAYAHQELPFEKLVEELQPVRDLSRSPLFQVMLVLQNAPSVLELPGLRLDLLEVESGSAKFDLTFSFFDKGGRLGLSLEYDRDLFDAATAGRMGRHLEILLTAAAADPDRRLSELPLLTEPERAQLLEWNATVDSGQDACLHELIERQVARAPDAVAVSCEGTELTYRELDARARRLARRLRGVGVGPEVRVGIAAERSLELVVGLLGILKAGGAYVPLDPGYPSERLAFLREDSRVAVLLTQERLLPRLPGNLGPVLLLDREEDAPDVALPSILPDNLAYFIYTSGSTGRPKGVAITHRSAVALVCWAVERFAAAELAFVLASTSICFDLSIFELFVPLSRGGTILLAADALALPELPAASEVTLINTVPSAIAELVRLGPPPARLRTVNLAGEPLQRALVRQVEGWCPGVRVLNLYGPSEDTTYSTWALVSGEEGLPAIGRPVAGTSAYLLDRHGNPVPVGIPGELHLGGTGLARGYFGRPKLTAAKFVPDPFATQPGRRLYATGDLARLRPDGNLEFLGRIDHQVKIRGFRIEPGEIEALLITHPGVEAAVVVPQEAGPEDRRLVAYVVVRPGQTLDLDELRGKAAQRLPGYMVPAAFMALAALPLTPNGKLDRRALPRPDWSRGEAHRSTARPHNPTEELLAGLWAELLGLEASQVGTDANFFALGGHSLLATRLISRVRRDLAVEVPLRGLFEAPTPAGLARLVLATREGPEVPPIRPVPRTGSLPLSFAQERLWFLDQLQPGSAVYNIPTAVRLEGRLDIPALAVSLREIVRRHETLRTTFAMEEDGPVQRITPPGSGLPPVVDLRELGPRWQMAQQLATQESLRSFDLERGPLWRATLLHLGAEEHCLLLTLHHIIADGWSMGVFVRELSALYTAVAAGQPSPLPELPIQYADVAVWQRQWLGGDGLTAQSAYWRRQLADLSELRLPTDRPYKPSRGSRGATLAFQLSAELKAGLEAVAHRERATLFMVLLGGFQALLSRWADQEDVAIGTAVANRNRAETEDLIGFFVNTLVLRTHLSGDPDRRELLRRVRETALGAYAHQDLPFEKLVEELALARDLSRPPLIGVLLVLQNMPLPELALPGIAAEPLPIASRTARLDLTLSLAPQGDGLAGWVEFATDLFDGTTVRRLIAHFEQLLAKLADTAGEEPRFSALPLLTPAEQAQVLVEWNDTGGVLSDDRCLHELLAVQAAATPDAIAVVCGSSRLTYGELELRANRLACRLRALGVGAETPVGVCLERGPGLMPALLGILKAGGAYVPLDPAYPQERLDLLLKDARVPLLVTRESLAPRFAGVALCVLVDEDTPAPETPEIPGDPDHLAYFIYTSGSTGSPKGVGITHRSAVALMRWAAERFSAADLAGVLASTSISFDLSVFELFVPLSQGGTVLLAADALALSELPAASEVTLINTVPSAIAELTRLGPAPPGLRTVNLAGEALQRALVQQVERWQPGVRVLNLYGPSEDTTYSTGALVSGGEGIPPIGRPLTGTAAYVLDRHGNPVPPGGPGELHLAGAGLARGYFGRPDLTAAKFIPDPFAVRPGGRLYATGDLARLRGDGNLEYLGRIDHQVKIRGFRIEPGEIEAVLAGHPGVASVAVVPQERGRDDLRLVAYVVGQPGQVLDLDELRGRAAHRLPGHMVPAAFVALPALPLTPNGKLDRRALPRPDWLRGGALHEAVAPRNPTEELLVGLWAELLGLDAGRVGIETDFFTSGGHSLLATRLISRVRQDLRVEVPVRSLFEAPTPAGFARLVLATSEGVEAAPIQPVPRTGSLPLSFAQERLWFLDQLEPGSATYNIPLAVRLEGRLDTPALAASLREIARRHEVLRTTFAEEEGRPVQLISSPRKADAGLLPVVDLGGLAGRSEVAQRLGAEEGVRSFDLERGPLWRATLLRLAPEEHLLLLTLHHIVADGWSMGVLVRELSALYAAAPLPELAIQYADVAVWQRKRLARGDLAPQSAYWQRQLADLDPLRLPTDRPHGPARSSRGTSMGFHLSPEIRSGLEALARRERATLFMVLLAGFQALLARLADQEDVAVGTAVANRNRVETEDLIGLFVNTLVLRTDLSGDPDRRELLRRVREVTLDAYAHQDLPFEKLVEELAPERDLGRVPLIEVLLVLQNMPLPDLVLPGLAAEPLPTPSHAARLDLTLSLSPEGEGLAGSLEFATDLFDEATVRRMLADFQQVLHRLADSTAEEPRLSTLPLLSSAGQAFAAPPVRGFRIEPGEPRAAVPPRNPIEEMLVGLWAELLGFDGDQVGIDTHFFAAGGHSLLATRLVSRVRADLRVEVPVRAVFMAPTPASLARLILATREGTEPPIQPVPRTGSLPLSFAQERLWFLDRLEPGSATYNIPLAVRLEGRLDTPALAASLREIARRHEVLRTTFAEEEGRPVQLISSPGKAGAGLLPVVDLGGLAGRSEVAQRLGAEEGVRSFDLERGPLWRAMLLRLAPEEHLLLFTLHHIVADGWSMGVLVRELSALYAAAPLPELAIQYADVAVWQRERLARGDLAPQSAYWQRQLADLDPLRLPTDRPHGPARSSRGTSVGFHLSPEIRAGLEALARRERATLFMVLLAGFQALLARLADQEDVAVGTAVANRNRVETEDLIGLFVNTLVLRTDLSGDPDRRELLRRVRQVTLDAYTHQDLPFEKLVEELAPERDLGRAPLVEVLLVLQNMPLPDLVLPGLAAEPLPIPSHAARLDLTLILSPQGEGLGGGVEFSTDLFDESTVRRMLRGFEQVLAVLAALAGPTGEEARLSALPLLAPAERAQLLVEWNDTGAPLSDGRCLHGLFAAQASATPEAIAVVCGTSRLTYREVESRAHRLARRLRALGVRPETPVGVCLERGPDLVPALLGILAAGGAYVPLDPAYPQERLSLILEDSRAPVVVTQPSLKSRLAAGPTRILVDSDPEAIEAPGMLEASLDPDHLAYFIYTSGSTGRPKGVAITHRSAVALVRWAAERFSAAELAGVLASTSISFDLSVFELFVPLSRGGTVLLAVDALALPELPAAGEVTLINTVPSAIAELTRLGPPPQRLRTVNLAGEALQRSLVLQVDRWHPGVRVLNLYGPSEDTTYSTWALVSGGTDGEVPPIGRPVAGTSVYLLDRRGHPVPLGVPGELHLAGAGLARGYFGRPALTAEKFVPDPFAAQPGGRLYATGDLARLRPDGQLEFLGRRDYQVKVRGFRIELGEIEAALAAHPAVRDAAVLVREEAGQRLVAYLTLDPSADPSELRAFLQGRLPAHMVPGAFVLLDAFPLMPNGKLDRRALAAPAEAAPAPASLIPRGQLEEMVAEVLAGALDRERIGLEDNFFDLGGHSLLATRAVSRLREALAVDLPVRQIFETPTAAALAAAIRGRQGEARGVEPPIVRVPRTGPLPLSLSQERLWFLDRLQPGSAAYNMPVAARLRGALAPALLARSLDEIVRRHETLRTTFGAVDGQPFQRIAARLEIPLPLLDLRDLAGPEREAELARRIAADGATPFDLEQGPLLRARLFRLAAEEWALLIDLHHIVSDGLSLRRLFSELAWLYGAFAAGETSPLPELEVQYADYACWQRAWLQGEVLESHLDYWRRQLSGTLPVLDLPADRGRPPVQTFHGGSRAALLPAELGTGLRALGRRQGATLFMTMFAAFNLLLHRLSGQNDLLVGIPIAGRNRARIENLIGFFINSLVLRTDLSGQPTFASLLAGVRRVALDAYAHQDLSFERLLQELRLERDLSRTPLFQVYFNFQGFAGALPPMPGLAVESLAGEGELSKFDLTLYVMEAGDGQVRLELVYNATLFSAERCREMLDQYIGLLSQATARPDAGIDRFSLLTPQTLPVLPDPSEPLDPSWIGPVHQHLTVWAARDPERPAVTDPSGTWSYGELEAQSNRLAHLLLEEGVRTGDVVAIHAHRSATLAWAVLGTLKAGATFVALDPSYPPARIIDILRLARPRAWLAMQSAGAVPEPLASFVAGLPGCLSVDLPPWSTGPAFAGLPATDPGVPVGPDDVAYIAFTSGSTGIPKGVLGRHGPLSHFLPWQCETFGLTGADRFSLLSGLAHDPLQRDLFTPLFLGAWIRIPDPAEIIVPGKLSAWMQREDVTVAHLTPAMGQVLTESGPQAAESLPALRYVFLVGDILTRRDVARLQRLAPGVACVNLYGSTETQRAVGYHRVPPAGPAGSRDKEVLPLGRGMKDVQLLVRNLAGQRAGIGELGEIAVRSPHLSRGYLGDEEGTARKFLVNPVTGDPGDRLYLTGDLGRYLPNGEVAFAGRADNQVKIRGFRIELGEIESQLGRICGVREAVVLATEDNGIKGRLVGFVVPEPGMEAPAAAELRQRLKAVLPAYMVPGSLIFLPEIPLTPNRKIDRRALLHRASAHREGDGSYHAPRTEAELRIAGILREVLGVERIGTEDNFFDLGGNSLLLLQVQSRVQAAFGCELPVIDLFSHPTVSALARHLAVPEPTAPVAAANEAAEQLEAGRKRRQRRFHQNLKAAERRPGELS